MNAGIQWTGALTRLQPLHVIPDGAKCVGSKFVTSANMSMTSRLFFRLVAWAMIALALAGCGRTEGYRYKLTVAVNTPDGVKRASSVARVVFWPVSIPERGIMQKLTGEALYLDLGLGRRPLIALLTSYLHPKDGSSMNYAEFIKSINLGRPTISSPKCMAHLRSGTQDLPRGTHDPETRIPIGT